MLSMQNANDLNPRLILARVLALWYSDWMNRVQYKIKLFTLLLKTVSSLDVPVYGEV